MSSDRSATFTVNLFNEDLTEVCEKNGTEFLGYFAAKRSGDNRATLFGGVIVPPGFNTEFQQDLRAVVLKMKDELQQVIDRHNERGQREQLS